MSMIDEMLLVDLRGCALIDYVTENAREPDCFAYLPAYEALATLGPGVTVKIGIQPVPLNGGPLHPEHFWAEIVERRGVRGFIVKVCNDLQPGFGAKFGDLLLIGDQNIWVISS